MKNFRQLIIILFTCCALTLTGCVTKTLKDADYTITQNQKQLIRKQMRSTLPGPPVATYPGYYVNPTPISLDKAPWLSRKITLQAHNIPFNLLVTQILRDTDASVNYQPNVNSNRLMSINYSGNIKGALDQVAINSGYDYQIQNGEITWVAFISKTFNIAFMPGSSSYNVGQTAGGDTSLTSSPAPGLSSSGSAGSGSNIVTPEGQLGGQQYSNLKGDLSVWEDLTNTLDDLKSPDGKVFVSQSTTSVTVYDHPENVRAMARYIDHLNRDLSREVAIQVEVLEINMNKDFLYGIDWNYIQRLLGNQFSIVGTLATGSAANISAATSAITSTTGGLAFFRIGDPNGSNVLINALSQQGRVSVVTQPRVVTMNNQMAEIRITKDTSYLQSVSTTTAVNAGTTTSLVPGIVTDGFSLYLLPKIQANKVYMQISSSLTTLDALTTVTNAPSGANVNQTNGSNTPTFQQIQVPTLSEKHFNQRTVIASGDTLVITGFQQTRDVAQRNQLFGIQELGATGAQRKNTQILVLITPTILGKV